MISLGLIAAIAIAVPALGLDRSIKKAIKKEVSKQISTAQGTAGATGAAGANGTARAYARVTPYATNNCTGGCTFDRAKGITSVTSLGVGSYCVTAPGISSQSVPAAVTVDWNTTSGPEGNASAMTVLSACGADGFRVVTERQPVTAVRNADGTGSVDVAGNAVQTDDVGFTIVIP